MPRSFITAALLFLGVGAVPAAARDLQVEVDVLHVGGLLAPKELESLLADPRLGIEATYQPTRLVDGDTARRERTLPLGSKLVPIPLQLNLEGARVERKGRSLRFQAADVHPERADYRLHSLALRTPIAPGMGRPQPDVRIDLLNPVPKAGANENALYSRHGAFDLGLRLRSRWSDATGAATVTAFNCHPDIQSSGNGQYRFRPQHPFAGLMRFLAPVVQSDPPSRPPAGQRSTRLREPYPEPLAGWTLSRNHLVQLQMDGQTVERLSIYGTQAGPGHCRRTRGYDALFAGGKLVALEHSLREDECRSEGSADSRSVEAGWLGDGSLQRYLVSTPAGSQSWDGFQATAGGSCSAGASPPSGEEVRALAAEFQRIRDAFLR